MKTRSRTFIQNLYHEIDDEEKAQEYLDEAIPLIGLVVMYFNSLEKLLDSSLCEMISDRSDAPGLIVIQRLTYSAKVDLYKRLHEDLCQTLQSPSLSDLAAALLEVGRLRNLVVHADWEHTDEEGYTFVHLKTSTHGMTQEYVQFSAQSLDHLLEQLIKARERLSDFWEAKIESLSATRTTDA